jgi:hypothetical protein
VSHHLSRLASSAYVSMTNLLFRTNFLASWGSTTPPFLNERIVSSMLR